MRVLVSSIVGLMVALMWLSIGRVSLAQETADVPWKSVDAAIEKGLPKTAVEQLVPILRDAQANKKYDVAIKAVCWKVALEAEIQGGLPEERIKRLRAEIDQVPEPMKPVMEAVLANWYWHYFQQNRWRFLQRTQTSDSAMETVGEDFTTWDLPRILNKIREQFQVALSSDSLLKSTSVADYRGLLDGTESATELRPTLYDVIAHNAIEFYASGEQAGAAKKDSFEISSESPIFGDANAFIAWLPETTDDESLTLNAVKLFQSLLQFHQGDSDRSAFFDADFLRLKFGENFAFGDSKRERFQVSLRRCASECGVSPIAARVLHRLAESLREAGDLVQAHSIAADGLSRFPDSVGGRACYNLIQSIEAPSSSAVTERVWNWSNQTTSDVDDNPVVEVRYRNVTQVHFRLVEFDFRDFANSSRWRVEQIETGKRSELLAKPPVASWSVDLPVTDDYQEHVETLSPPKIDKPGSYYLIVSHDANFGLEQNQLSICEVWVSDLSIVVRNHGGESLLDGFVLDARSGEPIVGAKVEGWAMEQNTQRRGPMTAVRTDANGMFRFTGRNQRQIVLHASHKDQTLSTESSYHLYAPRKQNTTVRQTIFFTDRSIYRPGQTIQFKGICLLSDPTSNRYETMSRENVAVVFSDPNGKAIESLNLRTNDYGSFTASVTAPRDRLMGRMTLAVQGVPSGQTAVTVEEYKRPKFQVELASPKADVKLGGSVVVAGEATAYTGAAIDGASVSWRVVRSVRYPVWWLRSCWWMPPVQGASQEIDHGITTTDGLGRFEVPFVAKPDLSVAEDSQPSFDYMVYADVTDPSGETRSDQRSVRVGYTSLSASMTTDDWLTDESPTEIAIRTESLDGQARAASGTLKVYRLKSPAKVSRPRLFQQYRRPEFAGPSDGEKPDPDWTNPDSWPLDDVVSQQEFATDGSGSVDVSVDLTAGLYRAVLETTDMSGKAVRAELPIRVLDPDAKKLELKVPFLLTAEKNSVEPGQSYSVIWGSGYPSARAFIEIGHRGKIDQSFWTDANSTQVEIRQPVKESMRGGFTVRVTMVRENRAHLEQRTVEVPWSNKNLTVRWEHFVSKLKPGAKETWTAVVEGPDAKLVAAEMVATLYDASLDAFLPHQWLDRFNVFRREYTQVSPSFANTPKYLQAIFNGWRVDHQDESLVYPRLPDQLARPMFGGRFARGQMMRKGAMGLGVMDDAMAAPMASSMMMDGANESAAFAAAPAGAASGEDSPPAADAVAKADFDNVSVRTNLNETAFFFPQLIAGTDGSVRMEFTMPEALTKWKFMSFSHDSDLRSGSLADTVVTAKDLMVVPNPPRFVREGDEIEFTVKVVNQSPTRQAGSLRLTFADARTGNSVDDKLSNVDVDKPFEIPAGQSQTVAWRIKVADGLGVLTFKAIGSTGRLSDGEEGYLPVLSRRVLVTESITLPIRGKQSKSFEFEKLMKSGTSDSIGHQSVTAQMVSNPSWYAVMALPYLMEYPHQCSEQTFNRLYANAVARHIASSDPKIQRVFEQWRATPALDSPLAQNEDLKSILLAETPWVRQSDSESQARRNVGILFDANRLDNEMSRAMMQLSDLQREDGMWSWFPGGGANEYITLYIATGFGRMRHLGIDVDVSIAVKSLDRLDAWMTQRYDKIMASDRSKDHLSSTIALYLYGRSFFIKEHPIAPQHQIAFDYWMSQAQTFWLGLASRQSQAHVAVAMKRLGQTAAAEGVMKSIKERSVSSDEMGMFWRDTENGWWWHAAPIETQAMMIEAFDEVMDDAKAVEDCKVWLLKQKQTQNWTTTKATADAVYSLLLRGSDTLASDSLVTLSMGGKTVKPSAVEAGTGFYEQRFVGPQVSPELGEITVTKVDDGVAWGSVHWQYFEDIAKVTPHAGTPLKLTKQLYVKKNTNDGPTLVAVDGPVGVGDELVVRIVLQSDRDMEYLHLKDYRGSGTEPVNVLSRYKFQDGLGYYESTRDTASHFFIDYLPKGMYVFEYSTRVQLRGEYQTGFANIQCMYAPEFDTHSESLPIVVK
ncbi:alpha-2-macroglobulin family protein [Rubripirellula reticaptiva]|uniref:alpha-2-macroglobulin family protein n=1 Tax=Rubripirellula reticaptiva TaxID=2528013 RepID=UPI0011B36501|nr:alpha-2-macroglobulin family protein [Rubripirellula reticaptiva]